MEFRQRAAVSAALLGLLLNIVAGVVTYFLTNSLTVTFATFAVFELVALAEAIRRLILRPKLPGLLRYSRSSPTGGDLIEIGESVTTEFVFWGISAKTIVHSDDFRTIIMQKAHGSCTFRFLILAPSSPHVALRASSEGDTAAGWKREIEANIDRLSEMREKHGLELEVRLCDSAPIFRLLFVNSNTLYLGFYPMHSQGIHSPLLVFNNSRDSLYQPIRTLFEESWKNAKAV